MKILAIESTSPTDSIVAFVVGRRLFLALLTPTTFSLYEESPHAAMFEDRLRQAVADHESGLICSPAFGYEGESACKRTTPPKQR